MPLPRTARHAVALVATLAPLMLIVGTAHAGVVSVAGSVVTFTGGPGEVNVVRAIPGTAGVNFTDTSAPLVAGDGCTTAPDGAFCSFPDVPGPRIVELQLLDGNDSGDIEDLGGSIAEMRVFGGLGNDTLAVGGPNPAPALVDGGPGDDMLGSAMNYGARATLRGGAGNDQLNPIQIGTVSLEGGPGADRLNVATLLPILYLAGDRFDGGDGNDAILFHDVGGPAGALYLRYVSAGRGFDTIWFKPYDAAHGCCEVHVDFQTCPACSVERVVGTPYNDVLLGDATSMVFQGGGGDDLIEPRGGFDAVFAGAGNDNVNVSGDGSFDLASCGPDADTALADRRDLVFGDCETVTR